MDNSGCSRGRGSGGAGEEDDGGGNGNGEGNQPGENNQQGNGQGNNNQGNGRGRGQPTRREWRSMTHPDEGELLDFSIELDPSDEFRAGWLGRNRAHPAANNPNPVPPPPPPPPTAPVKPGQASTIPDYGYSAAVNPFTFVNTYPNATGGSSGQTFLSHNPSVGDVANAVLAGGGSVDVGSGGAAGGMNPKHNPAPPPNSPAPTNNDNNDGDGDGNDDCGGNPGGRGGNRSGRVNNNHGPSCDRCIRGHRGCRGGPPICDHCRGLNRQCLWPPHPMTRSGFLDWTQDGGRPQLARPGWPAMTQPQTAGQPSTHVTNPTANGGALLPPQNREQPTGQNANAGSNPASGQGPPAGCGSGQGNPTGRGSGRGTPANRGGRSGHY